MVDVNKIKQVACDAIEAAKEELKGVSQEIWTNPELCYNEHHAHKILTDFLEKHRFPVERQFVCETGFRATLGSGRPHIAVICEFDALPNIGHACGHNLIAEAGVGAALGIKAAFQAAGKGIGKLTVLGTPAEEGGCGKQLFIEAGVFADMDAAIMVHPAPHGFVHADRVTTALRSVKVTYTGKASHAAAFPWDGINALDAAVMAYTSISCLRQQIKPDCRIHGIISNGGAKPNIIPEVSELHYYVRSPKVADLMELSNKVQQCFEAAATATGCQVEVSWGKDVHKNILSNRPLGELYEQNALALGCTFDVPPPGIAVSTDMGNVSHFLPSLHPTYAIPCEGSNHTPKFADASGDQTAQEPTIRQAKAMAMTVIDVFTQQDAVKNMHNAFVTMEPYQH